MVSPYWSVFSNYLCKGHKSPHKLTLGVATFRSVNFSVSKQTDQSVLRNSKALGLTTVLWHDFLLKISNRYHQLPPLQLTGEVFVVARPSSPAKDPAGADRDRKGHCKEPFTIWGCTASTKALVSARCWNRRSGRPNLLLCGGATAGYVALKTWPSPLDLILALEDGGGWLGLHSVLLLVMALITAPGHDYVFVILC